MIDIGAFEAGVESSTAVGLVAAGSSRVAEGDSDSTDIVLAVTRSDNTAAASVDLIVGGTATLGEDYTLSTSTVNFEANGLLTQTVVLSILGDTVVEDDETFSVSLANVEGAQLPHTLRSVEGKIFTDDVSIWVTTLTDEDDGSADPDAGTGTSLREAIEAANDTTDVADVIGFSAALTTSGAATILLTDGELETEGRLSIRGPGRDLLTISGNRSSRIFDVSRDGADLTIQGLSLADGFSIESGGAVNVGFDTTVTIQDSRIVRSQSHGFGGAVYSFGKLNLSDVIVTGNRAAEHGGGVAVARGTGDIVNTIFSNNAADRGGALTAEKNSLVNLQGSTISGNASTNDGGGIYGTNVHIRNSTLSGNTAGGDGGGAKLYRGSLQNSTVSGNVAGGSGGGFFATSLTEIASTTIAANTAGTSGGGLYVSSFLDSLTNSIIAGNFAGDQAANDLQGAPFSNIRNTLFGDAGTSGGVTHGQNGNLAGVDGVGTLDVSTVLLPLANNGGPTLTHALVASGPAVDTGDASVGTISESDQRGAVRIVAGSLGPQVDRGAVEFGSPAPVSLSLTTTAITNVVEGDDGSTEIELLVTRSDTSSTVTASISVAGGTATLGDDFTLSTTDISFEAAGAATQVVTLSILGDTLPETTEGFSVALTNLSGASLSHAFQVSGTIIADEANFVVTTLTDEDHGTTDPNVGDGLSLREAISGANANGSLLDIITFDPSLTADGPGTIMLQNEALYVNGDIQLNGPGAESLTISGNHESRILTLSPGNNVSLDGLRLADGFSDDFGGGIYAPASTTLTIANSVISGNSALETGGGIAAAGGLTIRNSTVSGNSTAATGGGFRASGSLTVVDSTITGNTASGSGGGFVSYISSGISVTRTVVSNNSSGVIGGGLISFGNATIVDSTISGNSAAYGGGGLAVSNGSFASVNGSTISGNTSGYSAGGIASYVPLAVTNSTISGNSAGTVGGGLRAYTATIVNSTISGNSSTFEGGGLHVGQSLTLAHSTVSGNAIDTGLEGAGLFVGNTARLDNSIVAGNTRSGTIASDVGGLPVEESSAHNLIGDAATALGLTHGTNGNIIGNAGSGTIALSTILGPLTNNGGSTFTHALVSGSPAIDSGDLAFDPNTFAPALNTDQRGGDSRIENGQVDIGAFEFGADAPATVSLEVIGSSSAPESPDTETIELLVTRSNTSTPVSVDLLVTGTAEPDSDFTIDTSRIDFVADGAASQTVLITVRDDNTVERPESMAIQLANPTGASLSTASAIAAQIVDNDAATLSVMDASVLEGDEGTTDLIFTVALDNPVAVPVSVDFRTQEGTATAGDFVETTGTATLDSGALTQQIVVTINSDLDVEADEQLQLLLSTVSASGLNVNVDTDDLVTLAKQSDFTVQNTLDFGIVESVSLAVSGDYVIVVEQRSNRLTIVDVSDPLNAQVAGTLSLNGGNISDPSVAVSGNYAYIVEESSDDLIVVDISDPTAPGLVTHFNFNSRIDDPKIVVAGTHAYVVDTRTDDLTIIDISDPAAPVVDSAIEVTGSAISTPQVAVAGDYVYIVEATGDHLMAYNVSDPENPQPAGSIDLSSITDPQLSVADGFAYVVDTASDSLQIFSLNIDEAEATVGFEATGTVVFSSINQPSLFVSGDFAYLAERSSDDLIVVDVSDKPIPAILGSSDLGGSIHRPEVVVADGTAYVLEELRDELSVISLTEKFLVASGTILNDDADSVSPTISVNDLTYTVGQDGGQPVTVDPLATVNDEDGNSDWDGGTLTVQMTGNSEVSDEISIDTSTLFINGTVLSGSGSGPLIATLSHEGGIVTGGDALTITFNGNATNAWVQNVLRAISYRSTSETPGTTDRTVTFTATDKNGESANDTAAISVKRVDSTPPVASIEVLPLSTATSTITLNVSVNDPAGEVGAPVSGVAGYDVYVAVDSGNWTLFAGDVPADQSTVEFTPQSNHRYWFRAVATDRAGNIEVEAAAPVPETNTYVGDVEAPETVVVSAVADAATGVFTLNLSGTDAGDSGLSAFHVYVVVDGGNAEEIALSAVPAGTPDGEGVYSAVVNYQGVRDGAAHSYRFYTQAVDGAENVEAAPDSAVADVQQTHTFAAPAAGLEATGIDVQNGETQRSYIRNVDVLFNDVNGLQTLIDNNRIQVERFALDDATPDQGTGTGIAIVGTSASGNAISLDFGSTGLGGRGNAGNGFYRIAVDTDGDGQFDDAAFEFFRLYGDSNGDGTVTNADRTVSEDVTGDGVVNARDRAAYRRERNKSLLASLFPELDD